MDFIPAHAKIFVRHSLAVSFRCALAIAFDPIRKCWNLFNGDLMVMFDSDIKLCACVRVVFVLHTNAHTFGIQFRKPFPVSVRQHTLD